jgi:pilus assembly protein CpaC
VRRIWRSVVLPALALAAAARAEPAPIALTVGVQRVLELPAAIERVAIGAPDIADVQLVSDRELLLTGKAPGSTSLHYWLGGSPVERVVRVEPADLPGEPPNAQVQIDIQIVEVGRRSLKEAGINLGYNDGDQVFQIAAPGVLSGITQEGGSFALESATGFLAIAEAFNLVYGDASEGILAALSLLEAKGLARVLAEPSLVAMSGQTASFLAGGEFPVPVVQGTGNGSSVTIEFKQFGIRVMVTPTVLAADRIALKVAPEVSQLDFTTGVRSGGTAVPGLLTRRADTTVELGDGERIVISGLVDQQLAGQVDAVPVLGKLPILGVLFKSYRFERQDREVLMVVSPTLVRPLARSEPTPKLPGHEYDAYDPGSLHLLFLEDGDFDSGAGFEP